MKAPYELAAPQNKGLWARPENRRLLVVDASYLIHRAYHAPGAKDVRSPDGLPTGALQGFTRDLARAVSRMNPTHLAVAFDCPASPEARRALHPAYKSSRPPKPADLLWAIPWCQWIAAQMGAVPLDAPHLEADDLIASAVAQVRAWPGPPTVVILTGDKDLAQLVGPGVTVWDMKGNPRDARDVEGDMGVKPGQIADLLAIAGDPSDDVPGVRGVGIKGAAQLLAIAGSLEALVEGRWTAEAMGKLAPKAQAVRDQREVALLSAELVRLRVVQMRPLAARVYPKEKNLAAFLRALGARPLLTDLGLGALDPDDHDLVEEIRSELSAELLASYGSVGGARGDAHPVEQSELSAEVAPEQVQPEPAPEDASPPQTPEELQPPLLVRRERTEAAEVSVGARLREARKGAGLTMGDAAKRLGVTVSQISDLERNQCPPDPSTVATLARLYGGDFEDLAGGVVIADELPPLEMAPADLAFDPFPPLEEERSDMADLVFGDCPGLNHVMTPTAAVEIADRLRHRLGPDYQVEVQSGVVISVRGGGYGLVTRCMSRPGDTPDGVAAELARIATSRRVR